MNKILKIVGILLLIIVLAISGLLTFVKVGLPNVGDAPDLKVEATPDRIARGKYLANSVAVCLDCHSVRDWSKFSGPITPGTFGKGGDRFDENVGFPGVYFAKNITPLELADIPMGELYRVITTGVTKEGRALFPLMPYLYYGKMDDEDINSIIAYLRTLEPIENQVQESTSNFPMNFYFEHHSTKGNPTPRPDPSDQLAYGGYLVNASGCIECHTQVDKGQIIKELAFSGGREFGFPDKSIVRSVNITPDEETGIGKMTSEEFIKKFKAYADSSYTTPNVRPGEYNSIMPWTMYAHMTEQDLGAIYTYLRTMNPIKNSVVKFSPAN